ncbi:MAG: hypothetical protein RL597_301, partial [Pseudomonadota bacterium]
GSRDTRLHDFRKIRIVGDLVLDLEVVPSVIRLARRRMRRQSRPEHHPIADGIPRGHPENERIAREPRAAQRLRCGALNRQSESCTREGCRGERGREKITTIRHERQVYPLAC